ncbi:MAG TPA: PASTA domain-containing protein [Kribbella sp.]
MTDLTDLLERTAAHTPVGPPPLDALRAGAARRRRRRTAGLAAVSVVAVGAVIAGSNLMTSHRPTTPVTSPGPAPAATRLVGFGHAAIAIPADWPTNKSSCGTPQQDTVLIDDPSAAHFCQSRRPRGVESVQLSASPRSDFRADQTLSIDGVPAKRQRTTCSGESPGVEVCSGVVGIPSLGVWFRVESSTSAAEVGRILDRIMIVPDRTGVPSYLSQFRPTVALGGADFGHVLEKADLRPVFRTVKSPSYPSGMILGVSPRAGTMLPVGSTVTVTVAR